MDITINTDFAQVEADDEQVNLTRFSLFFPEKRLFFQERSSIFDFNFGVFRVRRQVFNRNSYVGGMVTSRLGMDGTYNIAYGLDGIFRLFGYDYLTINWAQTFETDAKNQLFSIESSRIWFNWERRHIKGMLYNLSYSPVEYIIRPGIKRHLPVQSDWIF